MSELKIMSHLGPHLNVVNLLGACTKGGTEATSWRIPGLLSFLFSLSHQQQDSPGRVSTHQPLNALIALS